MIKKPFKLDCYLCKNIKRRNNNKGKKIYSCNYKKYCNQFQTTENMFILDGRIKGIKR
jgi:hypothetical protein